MRISKELATSIARKLTEKSRLLIDIANKEYGQAVYDAYMNTVPDDVLAMAKLHPNYFESLRRVKFTGHGFSHEQVAVPNDVLVNNTRYSQCDLHLTAALASKLIKLKRNVEKAEKTYKELFKETEVALLALKTYKNIESNIPAAKPFLPPPISNALVCNFDSLNRKINNQPEVSKELVEAK